MTLAEAALAYARAGVAILPLHAAPGGRCDCRRPCDSPGKHPRTRDGLTGASRDPAVIERWWRMWPDANVGGVVPDGFAILDADTADAETPPTGLVTETGRGWHAWYHANGSRAHGRPGIDVRHAGANYVVLPPSVHPSGAVYAWRGGTFDLDAAAPLPPEWTEAPAAESFGPGFSLPDVIERGGRNRTLASYGGALRARVRDDALVAAALADANRARCRPPLTVDELAKLTRSVLRYVPPPDVIVDLTEEALPPDGEASWAERLGVQRIGDIEVPDPQPLRAGILADGEHALLYGPGDTGKGAVAAYIVAQEAAAGQRVLVLDYEGHPREWARRLQGLRAAGIHYLAPAGKLAGPLWKHARILAALCDELGITLLVIDSVSFACAGHDIAGDPTSPPLYFAALQVIGRTSLTLAHVTKRDERWPRYPYGSMHWHSGARVTWAAEKTADEPHTVELRCRKHNDYPPQPDRLYELDWDGRHLAGCEVRTVRRTLVSRLLDAMRDHVARTEAELAERVNADGGEPVTVRQVHDLLKRYRKRGRFTSDGDPIRWLLADPHIDLEEGT